MLIATDHRMQIENKKKAPRGRLIDN